MMELRRDGDVHRITLCEGENRIQLAFVDRLGELLARVEKECDGAGALVIAGEGKFFSNGLDLDWLASAAPEDQQRFARDAMRLMGRLATFPAPTVAALNGHCFAAGALLALACDFRVMREDRGWICFPEVDVSVPIPPLAMAVMRSKLPPATLRDVILTGRRYAAAEAVAAGLADAVAPEGELQQRATQLASSLAGKPRGSFAGLKRALYAEVQRLIDPGGAAGGG